MKALLIVFLFLPCSLFATEPIEKHPEWDAGYTQKIRDYTTGPEFMTDLVDHLPASDKVPTPEKILGYVSGAPGHLTYAEDVHKYMRALEAASARVKVFTIGKTEEGREMILVVIAEEKTIADLGRYKEITNKLADPRKITEEEAKQLVRQGKPMYYATGAMHSPETGSPEMLMELAYRLAVEDTPMMEAIRNNIITLITPVLEVDGRDRMVDLARWHQANPNSPVPPLAYWGHYVLHDNNRDALGLALKLTQNVSKTFFEWHPQVIHDLHESIPFLYVSTGTGPYNAWLDPIAIDEWHRMAYNEVQVLTQKGLPGVWTHGFYDGWAPNYMFWVAHGHNAIGRFYETFGNGLPDTKERIVRDASQRDWYRLNPPYPKVTWSLRNNVNYQQSGLLLALQYMAENREHLLETFWLLGKRAIAKAKTEGPAAYVFEANQKRKGQLRDLLGLLNMHGIEVQQADEAFALKPLWPPKKKEEEKKEEKEAKKDEKKEEKTTRFSSGSFIVRMDQPYSRFADALLDTQYVRGEERVYDDTGWTLGYLKNVDFKRIVNPSVLNVRMHLWQPKASGNPPEIKGAAIAIRNHADTDLIRLRASLPDVKFFVTVEEWKQKGKDWPAGTFIISLDGNYSKKVQEALKNVSLDYEMLDKMPSPKMQDLTIPRIAILHTWTNTQDEGWFRLAFEDLRVPYDYISTQDVSKDSNLHSKYDVIVFPPAESFFDGSDIINGMPPGPALPWKKTDLTPNLGVDETEDMRPGLGWSGVQNLKAFVEEGGLLITVDDTARWAVDTKLARWVETSEPQKLKARGSILKANVTDRKSPVVFGYDDSLPIYYSGSSIFRVGIFREDMDEQRPSGRGSQKDPDVVQGRPYIETPEKPKPAPGEEGFKLEDWSYFLDPYIPKIEDRPRVLLSFPKEADQILLSGMFEGGDEIAGKPVVIDSPLGKGHILLFANNPVWRSTTQGDYALLFNAIFNYRILSLGWPPAPK